MNISITVKTLFALFIVFANIHIAYGQGFLDIEMSRGSNNNVFMQNDLRLFNQLDTTLSNDTQNQYMIGTGYKFLDMENSDTKIRLDYFKEDLIDNKLSTEIRNISLPFTYYTPQYRLRVTPSTLQYQIDGKDALNLTGSSIDLTRKIGDHKLGAEFTVQQSNAESSSYANYNGDREDFHLHYTPSTLFNQVTFKLGSYSNNYNTVDRINNSYSGQYFSSNIQLRISNFELGLQAKRQSRNFAQDYRGGFKRVDNTTTYSLRPQLNLSDSATLFADIQRLINASNLKDEIENKNYSQRITLLGLSLFW